MTIKELIENGKGYLELNENKIDLANPQFKNLMKWNEGIANGYIKDGIAYNQNGTELVWEWISLEEEFSKKDLEEGKELGLVIEEQEEETAEVVEDISTEHKGKDKTK
jgi:hypothetical protein